MKFVDVQHGAILFMQRFVMSSAVFMEVSVIMASASFVVQTMLDILVRTALYCCPHSWYVRMCLR